MQKPRPFGRANRTGYGGCKGSEIGSPGGGPIGARSEAGCREERKMSDTVFAFRAKGVVKIIRKLEAATRLAKALEEVLPAMYGIGDREQAD